MKNIAIKSVTEISLTWAKISLWATILFMIFLTILHFLKPELDPSWRMISEYAIGDFGWLMTMAFLAWAIGFVGLFISIRSQIHSGIGKIGLVLLLISALGILLAGLFTTDSVTTKPEQATTSGMIHSIGGTLGMAIPFANLFLYLSLAKNENWTSKKNTLKWATVISITGFVIAFVAMGFFLSQTNGVFSENTPVGYPNRLEVLCYCIWLILFSKQAISLRTISNTNEKINSNS